ncbi:MAG: ribonuclease [Bacteroidota bacterium]|nr:ribonuclease [Bacteroidota bacterium]
MDCGEGTQQRMMQYKVKWFRIDHIFISHLHGDHYYGLIGLLTTYNLLKRLQPLTIYAPALLKDIIEIQLRASNTKLNYELHFKETKDDGLHLLFENDYVEIFSFPLEHKIPTTGFLFKQKAGLRKLLVEKLEGMDVDKSNYKSLKEGKDITDRNNNIIKAEEVTESVSHPKIYAFCSDTIYTESIVEYIREADLLYHESTYLHESLNRAIETKHSTALQAAQIAKLANVKRLLIGHFSSRYLHLSILLEESKTVFENTELAIEGEVFRV